MVLDFKKAYKDLYYPDRKPHLIQVPAMAMIAIKGKGDPNDVNGDYQKALQLLYALSFTIKMSERAGHDIAGYYGYVVPPLEGLWWQEEANPSLFTAVTQKDQYCFWSMIRQPDFVDEEVFAWACEEVKRKKGLDPEKAQFIHFEEGLCIQMLHVGPYDDEPASFAQMETYRKENHLLYENRNIPGNIKFPVHHEIYLGDPRKSKPENLKTVLRKQVKNKENK